MTTDPKTLGQWNEQAILPIAWLFSIWLAKREESTLRKVFQCGDEETGQAFNSLKFQCQNPVVVGSNDKLGQSDFSVTGQRTGKGKKDETFSFITGEIKFTGVNDLTQLKKAIDHYLPKKQTKAEYTERLAVMPENLVVTVTDREIFAKPANNQREKWYAKEITTRLSEYGFGAAALSEFRCYSSIGENDGLLLEYVHKDSAKRCWFMMIANHKAACRLLAAIICGGTAKNYKWVNHFAEQYLLPTLTNIHSKLSDAVNNASLLAGLLPYLAVPARIAEQDAKPGNPHPANDKDKRQASRRLLDLFSEPGAIVTRDYVLSSLKRFHFMNQSDPASVPRWSRLLTRLVRMELPKEVQGVEGQWTLNSLAPMPLSIIQNTSGKRQRYPLQEILAGKTQAPVTVIQGPSGAGKSTVLEYLYWAWIDSLKFGGAFSGHTELPMFVSLQAIKKDNFGRFMTEGHIALSDVLPGISLSSCAILKRSRVCLIIDGYDQIADNQASRDDFSHFLYGLKNAGYKISRIVISSRPRFAVDQAADWSKVLDVDAFDVKAELVCLEIAEAELADQAHYIGQWLMLCNIAQSPAITPEGFHEWIEKVLKDTGDTEEKEKEEKEEWLTEHPLLPSNVIKRPLLLTLMMYLFVHFTRRGKLASAFRTEADIYEELMYAVGDHHPVVCQWSQTLRLLCEAAFAHMANSANTLGIMYAVDLIGAKNNNEVNDQQRRIRELLKKIGVRLSCLDAIPIVELEGNTDEEPDEFTAIVFLHPSFQEFLLGKYICDAVVADGRIPTLNLVTRSPSDMAQGDVRRSESSAVMLRIGRQSFKFLVGLLCRAAEDEGNKEHINKFLESFIGEYATQQYFYDVGYLDAAINEMRLLKKNMGDNLSALAKIVLSKWISHFLYGGTVKQQQKGIAGLRALCSDDAPDWYRLFALDHVQNRDQTNRESEQKAFVDSVQSFGIPDSPWRKIAIRNPNAFEFTLRAGHFWGHLGNLVLKHASHDAMQMELAIDYFSRSILFRAIDLRLQYPGQFEVIATRIDDMFENAWFQTWVKEENVPQLKFEGYAGLNHAIGDIAQQYCARGQAYLNLAMADGGNAKKHSDAALKDTERMKALWEIALNPQEGDIPGGLKYYVWTVALNTRFLMRNDAEKRELKDWETYRSSADDALSEATKKIGVHYEQSSGIIPILKSCFEEYKKKQVMDSPEGNAGKG